MTVLAGLALGAVLAVGTAVPASAASLPSTDRIYAYDCTDGANDLQLLEIQADGTAMAIGTGTGTPGTLCPGQPAWDPVTQKAYFVLDNKLWATDVSTGVSTEVAPTSGAGVENDLLSGPSLAIAPDGSAWVQYDGWVGTIDLGTAVVTQFPDSGLANYPRTYGLYYITAFAYNATDSKLYAIDAEDKTPDDPNELATMSQTTGEITVGGADVDIPDYQNGDIENMVAMAFDSSGRGWLIYSNTNLRSFDTATATIFDQGNLLLGGVSVTTESIFIAQPTSGGGGGGGWSPVDDGYLDYQRGRVEGEGSTDLPDTGGSAIAVNAIVGLGCLAVGSTLVAASRRRRYS